MVSDFFRELLRFFILYVARPVVLLCGALISSVYNVLFVWWLDTLTVKRLQRSLERDIRKEHSWIFEMYDAKIVPNVPSGKRYRQVFDYANVIVAVDDLLLNFVRGREEAYVTIAPAHAPHDWYDFGEAIDLASEAEPTSSSQRHYRMAHFRQLFEANIERLKLFFSKEGYGQSRRDRTVKKLIPL
jgi:hypothetical protein